MQREKLGLIRRGHICSPRYLYDDRSSTEFSASLLPEDFRPRCDRTRVSKRMRDTRLCHTIEPRRGIMLPEEKHRLVSGPKHRSLCRGLCGMPNLSSSAHRGSSGIV